ncbi:MAG: hypothetical protein J1E06_10580 [Acutalibacter sp.]|nr:hypothetical protein [Acutalibacter sp.]
MWAIGCLSPLPDASPLLTADENRNTVAWRSFALHGLQDGTYTGYRMDPATGFKTTMEVQVKNGTLLVEVPGKGTDAVLALHRK